MAPIYDTDLEQERWDQEEWKNFELWEKLELKLRKKKRLIVVIAVFIFFVLSSIPVVMDRLPYWKTVSMSAQLSSELTQLKKQVLIEKGAFRLKFIENSLLGDFVIEKLENCKAAESKVIRRGRMLQENQVHDFKRLTPADAQRLGFGQVSDSFCYSALEGAYYGDSSFQKAVFAFIHVSDLTEQPHNEKPRLDRISVLTVENLTAEISFN